MAAASALENGDPPEYDLFTIGGGSAGVRAARYSANYGARVAMCELPLGFISSDRVGGLGGTCVLRGCVPKKLLAYAGLMTEELDDAADMGWEVETSPRFVWERLRENKNRELERLSRLYQDNLKKAGVDVIEGRGRLVDAHTVEVQGKRYRAKNILVATGGAASVPPIPGAEHAITSDYILNLDKMPRKLVVVGGGYIGCEQATIWRNFGAEVHMLARSDLPLTGFDREAREFIMSQYQLRGLHYHPNASPTQMLKRDDGRLDVHVEPKGGETFVLEGVDQVLMATGRKPKTAGLGLEAAGVELGDKGGIKVDDFSRTNVPHIYAVGDVTNRIPLTPVARMEGTQFARHVFGGQANARCDHALVASVVFSSPNLAFVGLTEEAALEKHQDIDVYTSTFTPMKNSLGRKEVKAMCKLVVDAGSDKVLGIHMVGAEAAEIVQGLAVAMKMGLTKSQLDETVGIHPTSAEEFVTMASPKRRFRGGKPADG